MAQFSDTLHSMRGRVMSFRPGLAPMLVNGWINDRIRYALDARPFWADLLQFRNIEIPAEYNTGTVSVTNGSTTVTGAATVWPVSDLVNTTIPTGLAETGYKEVTPASMAGIDADSLLLADAAGPNPEVVAVTEVTATTFTAKFLSPKNAAATLTRSSLSGRQIRVGNGTPPFTVRAVVSNTSLWMDQSWKSTAQSGLTYRIVKMYYSFGADLKEVVDGLDPQMGLKMRLHVSRDEMNYRDPQRSSSGTSGVLELVDLGPNESGSMQYEIWPPQSSARQIQFLISRQWPELTADTDRPPSFINPTIFVYGAIADALRFKGSADDPFHNPGMSSAYESLYQEGLEKAKDADDSKCMRDFTFSQWAAFSRGGPNWYIDHDRDQAAGNF
jgi:hypothetical protein